jgi:NAD-dependent dihydropyrimidine dehydrogenase PreA subunit
VFCGGRGTNRPLTITEETKMVVEIKIDYDRCTSCKECVKACTYGVLEWLDDVPIIANPRECRACSDCSSNCPVDAISVVEK